MKSIARSACLLMAAHVTDAHKILIAGSLERWEHKYFQDVAEYLTRPKSAKEASESTDNTVFLLQHDTNTAESPSLYVK